MGGPVISNVSLKTGDVIAGKYRLTFTVAPSTGNNLISDSIQISLDGGSWVKVDSSPATTGGMGRDSIDATLLNDGVHILRIRAKDSGNDLWGYSDLIIFTVDNKGSSPIVTIISPSDTSEKSGNLTIGFTVTPYAGRSIDSCQISVDGFNWKRTTTNSSHILNTASYPDGTHLIQIRAFDNFGRIGYSNVVSFIFKNLPSVTITSPRPDSVVSGTVVVRFNATGTASSSISYTEISVDGGTYRKTSNLSEDTLYTDSLTDGTHTIKIRVTDSNGKIAVSEAINFIVKNSPYVSILSPHPDSTLSGIVNIIFKAVPVEPATIVKREIYINGVLAGLSTNDTSYEWNTVNLNDGQHTIQVKVTDSNGKFGLSNILSVTTFNTPIVKITAPIDTSVISGIDTIKFTISVPEGVTITKTEISFNGGEWDTTTTQTSHTWVSTDFRDGTHTIQIRAKASNGKIGYSQIRTYEVSNVPVANIIAPSAGEALGGTYLVKFKIDPVPPATIIKRQYSIDGGEWTDISNSDTSFEMNTVNWKNGTHTLQIRCFDNKGRIGYSRALSFVVDNESPIVANPVVVYEASKNNAKNGTVVIVTAFVKDNLVGLKTDSVILSSESIDKDGPVSYQMLDNGTDGDKVRGDNIYTTIVKVKTDSSGKIGYSIRAVDLLGNDTVIFSEIVLDNKQPEANFVLEPSPESEGENKLVGKTYVKRLIMKGSYKDEGGSGLANVVVTVKNDSGKHINTSPVELSLSDSLFSRIIELVPGKNIIQLIAIDKAGNSDTVIAEVTYLEPKATKVIDKKGGIVKNPDGASVSIPENALLYPVEITIVPVDPIEQRKPLNKNLILLNVAHDFGPSGTVFRKDVSLTLSYTEADLDKNQDGVRDIDPTKLVVVFWDGNTWRSAGSGILDTVARTVTVNVNHFTIYDLALFTSPPQDKFIAFWSSNPVKREKGSYFTYSVPEAGVVSLKIVDMAGDLVCQLIPENTSVSAGVSPPPVAWNGMNSAGRFAGAGLYAYIFTFKPASGGKATVIRKPIGLLY